MPATIYNTVVEQGADYEDAIYVNDGATGAALDLTGFAAKMQGKEAFGGVSLFTLTEADTATGKITLGSDGYVRWRLRATVTAGLPAPSEVHYDLFLLAPDGSVLCPVKGVLTVSPSATEL